MRVFTLPATFLLLTGCLAAQVNKSNLTGIVRDVSGAAVPEIRIRLTNLETGAARSELSDSSGVYRFTLVDRGRYQLDAERHGFKRFQQDPLELQTGDHHGRHRAHRWRAGRKCDGDGGISHPPHRDGCARDDG